MSIQVNSRLISVPDMVFDIQNLLTYDSNFAIWSKQGVKIPFSIVDIARKAGFKVVVVNDMRYIDKLEPELEKAKTSGQKVVVLFTAINRFFDIHYAYWDVFIDMLKTKKVGGIQLGQGDFIVATGEINAHGYFFDSVPSKIVDRLLNYRII